MFHSIWVRSGIEFQPAKDTFTGTIKTSKLGKMQININLPETNPLKLIDKNLEKSEGKLQNNPSSAKREDSDHSDNERDLEDLEYMTGSFTDLVFENPCEDLERLHPDSLNKLLLPDP